MSNTVKSLAELNKTVEGINSIKEYGAKGDGISNDTLAFQNMIADINVGNVSTIIIPAGDYLITSDLNVIGTNFNIQGAGSTLTRLLFQGCDGWSANFTSIVINQYNGTFSDMSLLTNVNTKIGMNLIRANEFNAQGTQYTVKNIDFNTYYDAGLGGTADDGWVTALRLNSDNVDVKNCFFNGSFNQLHTPVSSGLTGIIHASCTNVKITGSKFYGWWTAIYTTGQSEDVSIDNSTIVGCGFGMYYENLTAPSNNHVILNTHFSTWESCISFDPTLGDISSYNIIGSCFMLERVDPTETKTGVWVPISADVSNSIIRDILIEGGNTPQAYQTAYAVQVSDQQNLVSNVRCTYVDYLISVLARSAGNNFLDAFGVTCNTTLVGEVLNPTIYTNMGSNAIAGAITYRSGFATDT